ncbi:MAG TPA: 6-carboxytetrahydropterin synthase [Fimbriimonadales bacterium]|nr:6-carboxytetrahydropterin synthase [Fimbriimonadales bacterium]
MTRRIGFSCGHRFWYSNRTPEENKRLFGIYASPYNHGHNYVLDYSIRGKINEKHGMVINIKDLDDLLLANIFEHLNNKSLNDEIDYFFDNPPTLENFISYINKKMPPAFKEAKFDSMRLYENPTLYAEIRMEGDTPMLTISRVYEFCAAHTLHCKDFSPEENRRLFGKCNNPSGHGHNYEVHIEVTGPVNPQTGMIIALDELDKIVNEEIIERFDHKNLNTDVEEFREINPTGEMIAKVIWQNLANKLPVQLVRVVLQETPRNFFEYSGEDE